MKISIIGAGYVGLINAVCLAKLGNDVILIDIDKSKIKAICDKISPIYEQGLDKLLSQVHIQGSTNYNQILSSDIILMCLNTSSLEYITQATKQIAKVLKEKQDYCVIVVKSTVPPGTTEELVIPILATSGKRIGDDFGVCMYPEFLREGKAIYDFMNPSQIIIGEYDRKSGDVVCKLSHKLAAPTLRTNLRTAEMIKLAINNFVALKISFINEIGNICKLLNIDTYKVAEAMGLDNRIGNKYLNAGIGFGGSCLPKDLRMLITKANETGYKPMILEGMLNLNERQGLRIVEILKKHVLLKGAVIGLLGLAFKPETDDVRDCRAIKIVEALLQEGAIVKAYDPMATANFRQLFPQICYTTKEEILSSDAILIITEWEEFSKLDYRGKIVIDGRRIDKAQEAKIYEGVCW